MTTREELPVFAKWMEFLNWLLPVTEKFPKSVRHTLSSRLENLALDLVEDLVEARYSRNKRDALRSANMRLEKIRVLLRICHQRTYLSTNGYHHSIKAINEVGRMLGGWIKQQKPV